MTDYDFVPEFPYELEPATEKQIAIIEKAGINTDGLCKGQASRIIETIFNRRKQGLATPKQVRMLVNKGFNNVNMWTFEQASSMMNVLAQNHWRVPYDINPATYMPK